MSFDSFTNLLSDHPFIVMAIGLCLMGLILYAVLRKSEADEGLKTLGDLEKVQAVYASKGLTGLKDNKGNDVSQNEMPRALLIYAFVTTGAIGLIVDVISGFTLGNNLEGLLFRLGYILLLIGAFLIYKIGGKKTKENRKL